MTMLAKQEEGRALSLADYEARIHLYKEQIGTGYIGIGRTLNEAKEAGVVPHGQWETWVTETTGLTPRQAQRCMQAATEIKDGSALARLEMSKALMLLGSGLDADQQEEIAQKAAEDGATVKQLKEELRRAKLQVVQETGAASEIREQLKKAEQDRQLLEAQLIDTRKAYQKRMDQIEDEAYRRGMKDTEQEAREEIRQEYAKKIDYINSERRRLEENRQDLLKRLAESQDNESARWDEGFKRGIEQGAADAEKTIFGLRNELNGKKQYVEELQRTREDLLDAAEAAEQRAANAEAELEALKAGQDPAKVPAVVILNKAVSAFFGECELMPFYPQDLKKDWQAVQNSVDQIDDWCRRMMGALAEAADQVEAEGAVE